MGLGHRPSAPLRKNVKIQFLEFDGFSYERTKTSTDFGQFSYIYCHECDAKFTLNF